MDSVILRIRMGNTPGHGFRHTPYSYGLRSCLAALASRQSGESVGNDAQVVRKVWLQTTIARSIANRTSAPSPGGATDGHAQRLEHGVHALGAAVFHGVEGALHLRALDHRLALRVHARQHNLATAV